MKIIFWVVDKFWIIILWLDLYLCFSFLWCSNLFFLFLGNYLFLWCCYFIKFLLNILLGFLSFVFGNYFVSSGLFFIFFWNNLHLKIICRDYLFFTCVLTWFCFFIIRARRIDNLLVRDRFWCMTSYRFFFGLDYLLLCYYRLWLFCYMLLLCDRMFCYFCFMLLCCKLLLSNELYL
jgi:hypothetical protein